MATFIEIGKKYGKYLKDTELIGYLSIVEIEEKINKLTYSTTGKPLTTDDKLKVVDYITEEINSERPLNESESIDALLNLIEELTNNIKNGK